MANHKRIGSRKSHSLVGTGLVLVLAHAGATACGPAFDSCEDTHTCKSTGGSTAEGGAGASDSNPDAGATSGGTSSGGRKSSGGSAGEPDVAEGGASGSGGHTGSGGMAPGDGGAAGAGEGNEEGGSSQGGVGGVERGGAPATGGSGATTGGGKAAGGGASGGSHSTGGSVSTGGINGGAGEGGDDAGGAPGTDCSAGDTVLCTQLFGAGSACAGRTVACVNGRWPATCIAAARDCTSAEDKDCDGKPDNTADATCVCASGKTQSCDPTPTDAGECASGIALCIVRANNASSYWGACKPRSEAAPTYTLNRLWCPDNTSLGAACTQVSGSVGTLQSKCDTLPSTCGYLWCI